MTSRNPTQRSLAADLYDQPGHLLRRAHQIAVGVFLEEFGEDLTPREFSILRTLLEKPEIDQVQLARLIGVDTSSTASTAAKLEQKGLIHRTVSAQDRRLLSLRLTTDGEQVINSTIEGVHRIKKKMLSPMTPAEQKTFIQLLRKFVSLHNEVSRAPLRSGQRKP